MAYYDSFTKKPQSKRDDWRDDEMTRRPARDEGRAVEPERRCVGPPRRATAELTRAAECALSEGTVDSGRRTDSGG